MPSWFTPQNVALVAAGVGIGTAGLKLFDRISREFRRNALPSTGEPMIYIAPATKRLPNGLVVQITMRNIAARDIWISHITPRSRAHGRIAMLPEKAFNPDAEYVLDEPAKAYAAINRRLGPDEEITLWAWIAGQDWPVWHFTLLISWSPYGEAARPLTISVHCKM